VAVRVRGLRELQRDLRKAGSDLPREVNRELKDAAQLVADDARSRFSGIDSRSAAGMRPRVRGLGRVVVEQRRRRVTGLRPDYGALQMRRAFLPALSSKTGEVERHLERMLDRLADRNGF